MQLSGSSEILTAKLAMPPISKEQRQRQLDDNPGKNMKLRNPSLTALAADSVTPMESRFIKGIQVSNALYFYCGLVS